MTTKLLERCNLSSKLWRFPIKTNSFNEAFTKKIIFHTFSFFNPSLTEEDDVIGDPIEEAVGEGEDGDPGVEEEVGGERSQGPQQAAHYQAGPVAKEGNNDEAAFRK